MSAQQVQFLVCVFVHTFHLVFLHRYQYYLQLKKDVLEGRISCSLEQAIRLASLAVQGNTNVWEGERDWCHEVWSKSHDLL